MCNKKPKPLNNIYFIDFETKAKYILANYKDDFINFLKEITNEDNYDITEDKIILPLNSYLSNYYFLNNEKKIHKLICEILKDIKYKNIRKILHYYLYLIFNNIKNKYKEKIKTIYQIDIENIETIKIDNNNYLKINNELIPIIDSDVEIFLFFPLVFKTYITDENLYQLLIENFSETVDN